MESHVELNASPTEKSLTHPTYHKRQKCPSCFTVSENASCEIQSHPSAEQLPLSRHGEFLSGYTNKRVFFSYFRCKHCRLLYCPTYFTQEQLINLYNYQSENMAEVPLLARERTQKAYYNLLCNYPLPKKGDYLEIGADIGLFARFFTHNTQIQKLFLYEPNFEVHETLKKNMGNKDHKIMTTNYTASDHDCGTLSIAVIIHALDHILDPRQLMKDIYQHLKPGGIVFIVTHDESSLLARVLRKKWPPYTLQHPQLFNPSTIKALLQAEGYQVLATQKTPNYFPFTHFVKGGLTALGLDKIPIPKLSSFVLPIKLGNIATIAQKHFGEME